MSKTIAKNVNYVLLFNDSNHFMLTPQIKISPKQSSNILLCEDRTIFLIRYYPLI